MSLLSLVMIVKDEAETIERTLRSAIPLLEACSGRWTIVDTGSTDDTVTIVERVFEEAGVTGVVLRAPFVDYSTTRNFALDEDAKICSSAFQLMLSGAETLDVRDPKAMASQLQSYVDSDPHATIFGAFNVKLHLGICVYDVPKLTRTAAAWRYVGRVHEGLVEGASAARQLGPPFYGIDIHHEKSSTDIARDQQRWTRDIALLEADTRESFVEAWRHGRSWFYLGQTYECLGRLEEAERAYEMRIAIGGWWEEVFLARWRSLSIRLERTSHESDRLGMVGLLPTELAEVFSLYRDVPTRGAETLCLGASHAMRRGDTAVAFMLASAGLTIPFPAHAVLAIDKSVPRRLREIALSTSPVAGVVLPGLVGKD
jgi:hypothetical protein